MAEEEGCFGITFERKYYQQEGAFIKRSLRPREFRTGYRGLHVPRVGKERLKNEAESLLFIREHTDIPVPTVYCHFEDDEAYYLIVEHVEGESMADLTEPQKAIVGEELKRHLATLRTLKSNLRTEQDDWTLQQSASDEYVFCHNDLSQQNVVVDPATLKVKAILDWEYAGFFPAHFEYPFYHRLGPSVAIKDEVDDSTELLAFLQSREATAPDHEGDEGKGTD